MEEALLYQLALASVKGIGSVYAKILLQYFGDARSVFKASEKELAATSLPVNKIAAICNFRSFETLEKEILFLKKFAIRPLFFTDKDYPQRLADNKDAPILLYYKGNADLNAGRIISVIGTRSPSEYGKMATEKLVKEMAPTGAIIISGMAYGIDGIAHKTAVDHKIPTVGVLAHGLDRIYPPEHTSLARQMISHGGLLTGFTSGNEPEMHNFPIRNRLVAGLCDILVVMETRLRGGSNLTVENALSYGKTVFALPGRVTDEKSAGCNLFIRQKKAQLLNSTSQIIEEMSAATSGRIPSMDRSSPLSPPSSNPASSGTLSHDTPSHSIQSHGTQSHIAQSHSTRSRSVSPHRNHPRLPDSLLTRTPRPPLETLTEDERKIFLLMEKEKKQHMDDIAHATGISIGPLSFALSHLTWKKLLVCLPGHNYIFNSTL